MQYKKHKRKRMAKTLFFTCLLTICISCCHSISKKELLTDHQNEIKNSLQYVQNSNTEIRHAVASGDYITVEDESDGYVFHYMGKTYSDSKYIIPSKGITFVYFRCLMLDITCREILQKLQMSGIMIQYVIRNHNGNGNIAYPLHYGER